MRNKLVMTIIIFLSLFILDNVEAKENPLTYEETKSYEAQNLRNLISYKEGYIFSDSSSNNTILYSYDHDNKQIASKQFEGLINSQIIKYNNDFILAGIHRNTLKVFLIDKNLQIKMQKETSYFIDNNNVLNLYLQDNKVYLMLTEFENLSDNNLYEIDSSLNVKDIKLSSIASDKLKEMLKGDYYLIHNNDRENEDHSTHYISSTYSENLYYLVGSNSLIEYNELLGYDEHAILTILDHEGKIVFEEINKKYIRFLDVEVVKDKLAIIAIDTSYNNYLLVYDFQGNVISEEKIELDEIFNVNKIYKIKNHIAIAATPNIKDIPKETLLSFYKYEINVYKEENPYGTLLVSEGNEPYSTIEVKADSNSGYEIENIVIKDSQGNIIPVNDNKFELPNNDVYISVIYKEIIENPDTADIIIVWSIVLVITIFLGIKLHKKLSWLK